MTHASGNPTWQDYPSLTTPVTAATLENLEARLDALSAAAPVCEAELTTAYTGLPSASYLMSGNMSAVVDPLGMFAFSGGMYRITLPIAGRYDCNWYVHFSTANQMVEAEILLNVPTGTAAADARVGYSVFHEGRAAYADHAIAQAHGSKVFAAGDQLSLALWIQLTSDMPLVVYGKQKTRVVVRYVGPT